MLPFFIFGNVVKIAVAIWIANAIAFPIAIAIAFSFAFSICGLMLSGETFKISIFNVHFLMSHEHQI